MNFYAASEGTADVAGARVTLQQQTDYPWSGDVRLSVRTERPVRFTLRLRVPGWAEGRPLPSDLYRYEPSNAESEWTVRVAGERVPSRHVGGYLEISREWTGETAVELNFPMEVRRVRGHEAVEATRERVAFERGPLVYCFEGVEGASPSEGIAVPAAARLEVIREPGLLEGVNVLAVEAQRGSEAVRLSGVPYYAWANRGLNTMDVWLKTAP
ncbi:MAG TPA: hypothetical protein VEQ65_05825 [Opitutus sp.]|nr:hypothetical protein [Opitutus sp.]